MTEELQRVLVGAGYTNVASIANAEIAKLALVEGFDLVSARQLRDSARLDRSAYTVRAEWSDESEGIQAQIRRSARVSSATPTMITVNTRTIFTTEATSSNVTPAPLPRLR